MSKNKQMKNVKKAKKKLSSTFKRLLIMILIALFICLLKELMDLLEFNDILIKRVTASEAEQNLLHKQIEILQTENASLKARFPNHSVQHIQISQGLISENPPTIEVTENPVEVDLNNPLYFAPAIFSIFSQVVSKIAKVPVLAN